MVELNVIKKGKEIGKISRRRGNYISQVCADCGKERWVYLIKGKPESLRCISCAGKLRAKLNPYPRGAGSHGWKGGRRQTSDGYILVHLQPDDFFYPMASKRGYVFEHRLAVAKALNRCLLSWEIVHHKGTKYPKGSKENKSDNRYPENLELLRGSKFHLVDTLSRKRIAELEKRVTILEAENVILKSQFSEVKDGFITTSS